MGKKRVHELAKDFGLDNSEVIQALQAAGISVKTHSSSVYEEEAVAVLSKLKELEPAKPARRPGMVIVRRKAPDEVEGAAEQAAAADGAACSASAAGRDDAGFVEAPAALFNDTIDAAVAAVVAHDVAPALMLELDAWLSGSDVSPEAPGVAAVAVEASMPADTGATIESAASAAASVAEAAPVAREDAARVEAREATVSVAVQSAAPTSDADAPRAVAAPGKSGPRTATVVRMIDREKLLERVPSRRLGGRTASSGPPAAGARPPAGAGGGPSGGPPGRAYGQVTELKVVTDPFGRGREMINVGRDKKGAPRGATPGAGRGAPAGGAGGRRERAPNKREMVEMRERSRFSSRLKKKKPGKRAVKNTEMTQPKASKRVIRMKETIVVADLAHQLGIKAADVIRQLMGLGMMITQNQSVDFDTAQLVAAEHQYTVESVAFAEGIILDVGTDATEAEANLQPRAPVVTVMGHVDHGKTSLLDAIRETNVASGEAGGITQHIGACQVTLPGKGSVTFLDTPGHAAFTEMRARGAQVTDLVVLVVAADDGVMPQTEEAIRHAQDAKVPIIVAVNKMDRPEANADRVMQELSKFGLMPEAWGGESLFVQTSATKKQGITELVEAILLQAEVLELKANPDRRAVGTVVEAKLDRGRGPVATVLVQKGTLRRGDAIVVGECCGKIRAMLDDKGRQLKTAGPSCAVEVTGLDAVPLAGDQLVAVESSDTARDVVAHRKEHKRSLESGTGARLTLDDLMNRMNGAEAVELKIVLKADVQGSVEAVSAALVKLSTDEVKVNMIYGGVGAIKESDIMLAAASGGLVVGFGVRPDTNSRQIADREGVEIRTYNIIYDVVDDVRRAMEGLLTPESRENIVGRVEVREVFKISKVGQIAGCRVVDGKAIRSAKVRVLRDSVQIYEGRVSSLKHFKNDAREVESGLECGIGVEGFNDIKQGDAIEFFVIEEIARTLDGGGPVQRGGGRPRAGGGGGGGRVEARI